MPRGFGGGVLPHIPATRAMFTYPSESASSTVCGGGKTTPLPSCRLHVKVPHANRRGGRDSFWCYQTRASDPKWSGSMQETMSLTIDRKLSQVFGGLLRLPLPPIRKHECSRFGIEVNRVGIEVVERLEQ